jgi:TonB family protein
MSLALLVLLVLQGPPLQEALSEKYGGKVFWVRDFRSGSTLRFAADGTYQRGGNPGVFGVDGGLQVDSVTVNANRVELRGRRVYTIYNPKTGRLEPSLSEDQVRLEFARSESVVPDVGIDAALLTREELPAVLPPFWSRFILGSGERPRILDRTGAVIPAADPATGMTPKIVRRVAPVYPAEARRNRYSSSVVVRVVVDEQGKGEVVDIVTPAGFGLDQAAMTVIDSWEFEPARLNGKPVKVYIRVRFDFNADNP